MGLNYVGPLISRFFPIDTEQYFLCLMTFSLTYFIIRLWHMGHVAYEICVSGLFMLLRRFLWTVAYSFGELKSYTWISDCAGECGLGPQLPCRRRVNCIFFYISLFQSINTFFRLAILYFPYVSLCCLKLTILSLIFPILVLFLCLIHCAIICKNISCSQIKCKQFLDILH